MSSKTNVYFALKHLFVFIYMDLNRVCVLTS